jgi:AraC family transcriptional regulator
VLTSPAAPRSVEDVIAADVVDSSRGLPWPGLELMTARIAQGGLDIDGLATHTLAINVGRPFRVDGSIDGRTVFGNMHPGAMKLVPAGPHSTWVWDAGRPIDMLHVSISDELLRVGARELGSSNVPDVVTNVGFVDEELARLSYALAGEQHAVSGGSLWADALRVELIARLIDGHTSLRGTSRANPKQRIDPRTLRLIADYIESNLDADMRIADLATLAGMSRFHFARVFRATVGTTPHRYVLERRLERARQLLQTTPAALRDIAAAIGFADQSHLTRLVKRRFGVTPGVLRSG